MNADSANARFEVVRRLGAGGMGEVLLAWQLMPGGLSRLVVLKTILPHLADTKHYVDLFVREARIGASMSHPNLVQILDVTSLEGRPCIVMEFLRGIDVSQMLRKSILAGRPPSEADLVAVIAQAADGLAYAHEHVGSDGRRRSVIHRDVSPQNLYLTAEGAVKVLDFGVARAAEDPRTQTGELRGKFAYMAPEMLGGSSQSHSPSVDQFALGVMLWEGLTLRRLFYRASPVETVQAVAQLAVPPPSTISGSSPLLDGPVLRALARDPAQRYPTCAAFAAALRSVASQLGPSNTESSRVSRLVHDLAPETLGEITADGPSRAGPTWLVDETNPNETWAAPWEPTLPPPQPAPAPRSRLFLGALVGLVVLGAGGAAVAWPSNQPSPSITVSFEVFHPTPSSKSMVAPSLARSFKAHRRTSRTSFASR